LNKAHIPEKPLAVAGIREEDIKESFIRSSAPGGQNVNKTSTCVYLKHLPTGLEVKCQIERSQAQNRYLARKILAQKLAQFYAKPIRQALALREKLRRQKRKRSHAQKVRVLEDKRRRADKKINRRKIREIEVA